MSVYNFDIKEIAEEYIHHYYVNVFLKGDTIDVKKLESNLHRDCDFYKYIPFGLMEEICKQLLESSYDVINIEEYINKFGLQDKTNEKIKKAVQNIQALNNDILIKEEELKTLQAKRYNNEMWLKDIFKRKYKDKIIDCYWYSEPNWYNKPKDECYVIFTKNKEDAMEIAKEIKPSSYKIDKPLKDNIYVLSLYL